MIGASDYDEILSERDAAQIAVPAIRFECSEGFMLVYFGRRLVGRCDLASRAWFDDAHRHRADVKFMHEVFCVRIKTPDRYVRSESIHRQRRWQPHVEIFQRFFSDQQYREARKSLRRIDPSRELAIAESCHGRIE